ncbi:MAG: hypothetical protein ACT4NJ_03545 [Nitrosopumilaceae archaeon]
MEDITENDEKKSRKNFQYRTVVYCSICGKPKTPFESIRCPFCSRLCCSDCVKPLDEGEIRRQVCKICHREKFTISGIISQRWKETLILVVILILFLYFRLKSVGV